MICMDEVMGCLCGAGYAGLAGHDDSSAGTGKAKRRTDLAKRPWVRELAQYHKNPCHYEHAEIDGGTALSGICGRTMDLTITMDEQDFNVFSIQLAADEEYETAFTYHKGTGLLEIDRTYCGVTKDVVCVSRVNGTVLCHTPVAR